MRTRSPTGSVKGERGCVPDPPQGKGREEVRTRSPTGSVMPSALARPMIHVGFHSVLSAAPQQTQNQNQNQNPQRGQGMQGNHCVSILALCTHTRAFCTHARVCSCVCVCVCVCVPSSSLALLRCLSRTHIQTYAPSLLRKHTRTHPTCTRMRALSHHTHTPHAYSTTRTRTHAHTLVELADSKGACGRLREKVEPWREIACECSEFFFHGVRAPVGHHTRPCRK